MIDKSSFNFKEGYYADIRLETKQTTSIAYLMGELKSVQTRTIIQAFIRVFDGKMWYYASTFDIKHLNKTLSDLYDLATYNQDILNHPLLKRFEINNVNLLDYELNNIAQVNVKIKQNKLDSYVKALPEDLTNTYCVYSDVYLKKEFISSLKTQTSYDKQMCGIGLTGYILKENDRHNFVHMFSGYQLEELDNQQEAILKQYTKEKEFLNNSTPVVAGTYPVVLSQEASGIFAHESFGHKSEADFMLGTPSLLKEWPKNKLVASELVSIIDDGQIKGAGYTPIDDEGNLARTTHLIKDGLLVGRLHSTVTSLELDEAITGNSRAISASFEPIVRMTTTFFKQGSTSFEDLIAPIKEGFYIDKVSHGSGMSTFTIAPTLAYKIIDGKLADPVKISVITGDVFKTLGLIEAVGNDLEIHSSIFGGCGKNEQSGLMVGTGGPCLRVKEMKVL